MTLDQFVLAHNGQFVDVDGEFGAQCWDLVELYAEQVLGVPKQPWAITLGPLGDAKEAWTVFDAHMQQYFTKVPAGQAQPGDINVYNGHDAYPEGHINIQVEGDSVFEQNADPDGSPAHVDVRPTTYLLGSLRLKGGEEMTALDEEGVRILAAAVLERWPQPIPVPTPADLMAHVGGDALAKLKEFWYSAEGVAANQWRADIRNQVQALEQQVAAGGGTAEVAAMVTDLKALVSKYGS